MSTIENNIELQEVSSALWQKQQEIFRLIEDQGGMKNYFNTFSPETKEKVFSQTKKGMAVVCIDEGCNHENFRHF